MTVTLEKFSQFTQKFNTALTIRTQSSIKSKKAENIISKDLYLIIHSSIILLQMMVTTSTFIIRKHMKLYAIKG